MKYEGLETLPKRLREARENAGLTIKEAAKELGVKYSRYANWENGTAAPNAQFLYDICKLYDVSADELLQTRKDYNLSLEEAGIIKIYRSLPNGIKNLFHEIALAFQKYSFEDYDLKSSSRIFRPVYDIPASAGTGQFLDSDHYEMIEFPEDVVPSGATFGVRVWGDSMEPDYPDGSIVFVHHTKELKWGDIGVFILNGDTYIKRLGETGLESINEKYKTRIIDEYDDLRIVGKVIGQPYVEK